MATVKWVIAGTFEQANLYSKQNREDGVVYKFLSRPEMLRGISNPHGVFVGSWRSRTDILEILDILVMSSHEHNPTLVKLRGEAWKEASNKQIYAASAASRKDTFDALEEIMKLNAPYTQSIVPTVNINDLIKVNGI